MKTQRLTDQFQHIIDLAAQLAGIVSADALMILLEGQTDWERCARRWVEQKVLLAADFAGGIGRGRRGRAFRWWC